MGARRHRHHHHINPCSPSLSTTSIFNVGWDDLQGRGRCDFEKHIDNAYEIRVRVSHGPRIFHPSSMCFFFCLELAGVQHISRSERPMLGSCSEDAQRLSLRGRIGGSL